MIDDVSNMLGRQAAVNGVEHAAHGRHGQIYLQVLGAVPHKGADPITAIQPQSRQTVREARAAVIDLLIGAPVNVLAIVITYTTVTEMARAEAV